MVGGSAGARCARLFLAAAAAVPLAAEELTVHLVCHTHDDVGWLKTVDQYYDGLSPRGVPYNGNYVKLIIDSVILGLRENPDRKFTYVEQAFFQRWWRQQGPEMRNLTKHLVSTGQLDFANGGWCMHDEAAAHYLDMIDQTTLGHRFLMEEFGVAPSIGWQLDPFGHSSTQAALLSAEVGFNGLFFGRIDYQDMQRRISRSEAEFVWRASPSLGEGAQVFTGLTGEYLWYYGPPKGFNFGFDSHDDPIQDDPALEDYNVQSRVDDFVKVARQQAKRTRGSNVMWTMGSDFEFMNALRWFDNLDKLIKHVNLDGRVRAVYSTPAEYLQAKAREAQEVSWPLKTSDFFPYADGPHQFWTGYFTSRPALKRYIRETSAVLQVARQMSVARQIVSGGGGLAPEEPAGLQQLAEAMGVAQHHDAVSGTSKQHVADDYAKRLAAGRAAALRDLAGPLGGLAGGVAGEGLNLSMCDLRNVSVCAPTQAASDHGGVIQFIVWNGLAQARSELVELPAGVGAVSMADASSGEQVPVQLVPSLPSVTNYNEAAYGSNVTALFVAELPPLGFRAFLLQGAGAGRSGFAPAAAAVELAADAPPGPTVVLENDHLRVEFVDGALSRLLDKGTGLSTPVRQSWLWYQASEGNKANHQASGAYIFRPVSNEALPVPGAATPTLALSRGPLADEVRQQFGPWVSQRVRLAKAARHLEITYTVGPIPVDDGHGKEIVTRFVTDIASAGNCSTDSNGREMIERRRDYRDTWKLEQTEPVAGNYFPVTTSVFIRDASRQLTVLTDAAQAGTGCVRDGELELMVHRRLLKDDGRGVAEALNESKPGGAGLVVRGRHLLSLAAPASAAASWRPLADALYMPPLPLFLPRGAAPAKASHSVLAQQLPPNVQVVTLASWDEKRVLLRLAHQFGVGEDPVLSQPAKVDLASLFAGATVKAAEERGLAATITREEVLKRRVAWKVDAAGATVPEAAAAPSVAGGGLVCELGPLQIKTFLVELAQTGPGRAPTMLV